jgi:hypothetical protein
LLINVIGVANPTHMFPAQRIECAKPSPRRPCGIRATTQGQAAITWAADSGATIVDAHWMISGCPFAPLVQSVGNRATEDVSYTERVFLPRPRYMLIAAELIDIDVYWKTTASNGKQGSGFTVEDDIGKEESRS